jgi:hypothetical protein
MGDHAAGYTAKAEAIPAREHWEAPQNDDCATYLEWLY